MKKIQAAALTSDKRETGIAVSRLLTLMCFLVYACSYIARGNFSFVRSMMIDKALISVGTAGIISAVYFIFYAVGQLVNGIIADKKSPFAMVSVGLLIIAVSNFCMTFSMPAVTYCVLWAINGFGQSMLWSPVFFINSNVMNSRVRYFSITAISLCTPVGKTSCSLLSGLALKGGKWESVFYMASLVIFAVLVMWIAAYLCVSKKIIVNVPEEKTASECASRACRTQERLAVFVASGLFIVLPSLLVYGLFYNGVVEVIPSILSSKYELSASAAAMLDSVIPIVGMSGVFVSHFFYKMLKRNEVKAAFWIMLATVVPVAVMLCMSLLSKSDYVFGQYADALIFVLCYGLIYVLQLAFGHTVVSLMSMRFSKFALAATVSGITNAVNYGGSAIATYGMSYAVHSLPLYATVMIWLAALAVACVTLFIAQKKWTAFAKKEDFV